MQNAKRKKNSIHILAIKEITATQIINSSLPKYYAWHEINVGAQHVINAPKSRQRPDRRRAPRKDQKGKACAWLCSPALHGAAEMYIQLHVISVTKILIILRPMFIVTLCKVIKVPVKQEGLGLFATQLKWWKFDSFIS